MDTVGESLAGAGFVNGENRDALRKRTNLEHELLRTDLRAVESRSKRDNASGERSCQQTQEVTQRTEQLAKIWQEAPFDH